MNNSQLWSLFFGYGMIPDTPTTFGEYYMRQFISWFNSQSVDEKFECYVVAFITLALGIAYVLDAIL